jgi:hypothetical protein
MLKIFTFTAILALAGTFAMGAAPAKAQGASSGMERCMSACQKQNGRKCESYCSHARSNR